MSLADKLQLARFLAHLASGTDDLRFAAQPREAQGARYDLYLPQGALRGAVVAVHGGDRHGWRNAKLARLCRALARSSVACAAPQLTGLARGAFAPGDLDELASVAQALESETGQRPGLIGFSLGGGYALTFAARIEQAVAPRFVVAVGAFHDLGALLDWHLSRKDLAPKTAAEWDDFIYLRLALAYWFRAALQVKPELEAQLVSQLERYCDVASDAEKRRFYEQHLRALDALPVAAREVDRQALAALSPTGRLTNVRCPVTLIHDRFDTLVPLSEAERLLHELEQAPDAARHKLVVTGVLSHVTPTRALDLAGLARLSAALEPLVSAG